METIRIAWQALRAGGPMIYPLLGLAVLATALIIDKAYVYWRYVRLSDAVTALLESHDFGWIDLELGLRRLNQQSYFLRFFHAIAENREKPLWWIESRAGDEAQLIEKALSRGLWVLETTVTAAPLLGLLGTITGMMGAFNLIGAKGVVDPTGVTGGVAEALISTALGLGIAIVALFGFNYLSQKQARTLDEMERLGTRIMDRIRASIGVAEVHHEAA